MTFYTLGHSTRSVQAVEQLLDDAGVDLVADVRRFPGSRKNPQWASSALEEQWPSGYVWLGEALGGRRKPTGENTNAAWDHPAFRGYADWMRTDTFLNGLDRLESLACHHTVAVMCAEAVWWRCHRRMITDALLVRGHRVVHLLDNGHHEATMTPFASVDAGRLTYPASPE